LNIPSFICDANHDGVVAQSKRKILGQQAIPTIRCSKEVVVVERGNTGPLEPEDHRLLRPFPLPTLHPPKSASALSGNWDHSSPQEWLQLHIRFYHNK